MGPGVSYTRGKSMLGLDSNTTRFQQPLFTGGRLLNTVKENSAKRDSLDSETIAAEQDIMSRVVDAYADSLRLQKNLKTGQVNVDEHQRLLDMIERRNKAGLSSDNDVVLARMRLQQASSELAQIQSQNQTQRSALEDLISQSLPPQQIL
jgi:adhesin transport system outer membrane protein